MFRFEVKVKVEVKVEVKVSVKKPAENEQRNWVNRAQKGPRDARTRQGHSTQDVGQTRRHRSLLAATW